MPSVNLLLLQTTKARIGAVYGVSKKLNSVNNADLHSNSSYFLLLPYALSTGYFLCINLSLLRRAVSRSMPGVWQSSWLY